MTQSDVLFERAQRSTPGGVNSPVRAFRSVGGTPRFIASASGAYLTDVDGNRYIDYIGSWGPMILGHGEPAVIDAIRSQATVGVSYGAPTELEIELAELIIQRVPSIETVRMVNSGTEATMSAIRLARGATGRDKIVKFEGCYHGHGDSLLVKAGSGALTLGVPSSPGVPASFVEHTLTATFNELASVEALFDQHADDIACIIVEPVAGNMNLVPPVDGFLEGLRALCDRHDTVLIFDEVMTGFRVHPGGAQGRYNVRPDLTTLGKIVGGGLPVGAFGGRTDIMEHLSPVGPVYQAGTLSGNPLAMAAGLATLRALDDPGIYQALDAQTERLTSGLSAAAAEAGIPFAAQHLGSMFGLYFRDTPPQGLADVSQGNAEHFKAFFHGMLERGVYLAPSSFEAGFLSAAHHNREVDHTIDAARQVLRSIG